jgi:hypothetical protein
MAVRGRVPPQRGRCGAPAPGRPPMGQVGPSSARPAGYPQHRRDRRPHLPHRPGWQLERTAPEGEEAPWRAPGGDQAAAQDDRGGPRRSRPEPQAGRSDRTPDRLERVCERRARRLKRRSARVELAAPVHTGRPERPGREARRQSERRRVDAGRPRLAACCGTLPRRPWPATRPRPAPRGHACGQGHAGSRTWVTPQAGQTAVAPYVLHAAQGRQQAPALKVHVQGRGGPVPRRGGGVTVWRDSTPRPQGRRLGGRCGDPPPRTATA